MHVLNVVGIYLLKLNCGYDIRNCGICSKLTVKTLKQSQLTPLRFINLLVLIRLRSSNLRLKNLFIKILQFSQENTFVGDSL